MERYSNYVIVFFFFTEDLQQHSKDTEKMAETTEQVSTTIHIRIHSNLRIIYHELFSAESTIILMFFNIPI